MPGRERLYQREQCASSVEQTGAVRAEFRAKSPRSPFKGMEGVYDVREDVPESRRALELWADYLESCETSAPPGRDGAANVVRLRLVA